MKGARGRGGGGGGGGGGGEFVQVQGGHIVRSTIGKDRHSKVYTSKGLRDRRVRLSAHTAIQFYDVQDRLGYDRPSKAVDWLINKAKTAIDRLSGALPWQPNEISTGSNELALDRQYETPPGYSLIRPISHDSPFMAPSEEPHAALINSTKPLCPMNSLSSPVFLPRASFLQGQDLGLSLHTFQADNQQADSDNQFEESFQRMEGWNGPGNVDSKVGLPVNSQPHAIFSAGLSFSQREPLQSNWTSWNQRVLPSPDLRQFSDFVSPFELGFRVPARIYGEEDAERETHQRHS